MLKKTDNPIRTSTTSRISTPARSTPRSKSPASTSPTSRRADQASISREAGQKASVSTPNFSSWASRDRSWTDGGTLRPGMDGDRVRGLQQTLKDQGYDLQVDGKFGPQTEATVRAYQEKNHLKVDGLVGQETIGGLQSGGSKQEPAAKPASPLGGPEAHKSPAARKPVDSFTFRSDPQNPETVKQRIQKNKAQGKSTMVGIDPNNEPAAQKKLLDVARAHGAQTHLYLEGRGGPTASDGWDRSEWERTRKAAASLDKPIHLTRQQDNDPAMKEWNDRGWQEHSIRQARQAKKDGFSSVEIDNINRLDSGDNTRRTMDFYRKYANEFARGDMPTLMMKNQSIDELKAVQKAVENYNRTRDMSPEQLAAEPASVRNNRIPREMFSDFHIFENDSGNLTARHIELTQALGIKLLQSRDTRSYGASGDFR